ncbi:MAG: hypothetical protein AB7F78_20565 [Hyphomicrobiaceae bacterium]
MSAADGKLRLVLSVFEPIGSLEPALGVLAGHGVSLDRAGLIVKASSVAPRSAARGLVTGPHLAGLVSGLAPLATTEGGEVILASPGLLTPWRAGWRLPALWYNDVGDGDPPRLIPDLERQVTHGAAILAIQASSPAEQRLSTSILLDQSSSPVLALETSMPPRS